MYLAMKQYRRSRPEASREGVRRAKAILEGEKETGTGRRVLNTHGGIPSHPLLRRIEVEKIMATLERPSGDLSATDRKEREEMTRKRISDLQKREDFLRAMANFRPKETVFEAFATGGQKDVIMSGQVDKCASGSGAALVAMRSMRRQMKIARDKGSALVIAGSRSAMALNGELLDGVGSDGVERTEQTCEPADGEVASVEVGGGVPIAKPPAVNVESKRHLSKAERKKMKQDPNYATDSNNDATSTKKAKAKRGADFRDDFHFIETDVTHDSVAAARSRQMEAAMQPSAASSTKGSTALAYRIEENMLDIVGDENVDLIKRQRMMRWDKSKRKYVQTTVGDELSGESKTKKTRLESGQLVKGDKLKLGELYEKWQKKTNRSIGRVGVFDDVTEDAGGEDAAPIRKGQKAAGGGKKANAKNFDDERKTVTAIRKEREKKEDMRVKNMKKGDRRQLERKQRTEKAAAPGSSSGKKGIKAKGRWSSSKKGCKR
jgi:ATP-dependent RNA helicase DDX54/DBP10